MNKKANSVFYPGNRFLIAYLSFLSAFAPISTDMYLPALPEMAVNLQTSNELASYSISSFLLIFSCSMLFWGPMSDRFGRKPILLAGSFIYVVSSIAIALSHSIYGLLLWRGLQALGSGAASAISLAIVKDILRGASMEKFVTLMQASVILAPIAAPVLGGWMLTLTTWRGIFWCLALCGTLSFLGALCLRETGRKIFSTGETFKRIGIVLSNRKFLYTLYIFSIMSMPFMSYLGVSAFIFQDMFHLSAQTFSLFFAFNAAISLLGPFAHMLILRRYNRRTIITIHLLIMAIAGFTLIFAGTSGPWAFALFFAPVTFCGSAMRPPSTVIMMESNKGDNGIVSSLINCGGLLFGSLSMFLATMAFWKNPVIAVGGISGVVSTLGLISWLILKK